MEFGVICKYVLANLEGNEAVKDGGFSLESVQR